MLNVYQHTLTNLNLSSGVTNLSLAICSKLLTLFITLTYRSVREYCRWMIDHPEHRRAPYLSSLGMFDLAVLEARHTMELNLLDLSAPLASPTDAPAPIDQIRRKLSELAEPTT